MSLISFTPSRVLIPRNSYPFKTTTITPGDQSGSGYSWFGFTRSPVMGSMSPDLGVNTLEYLWFYLDASTKALYGAAQGNNLITSVKYGSYEFVGFKYFQQDAGGDKLIGVDVGGVAFDSTKPNYSYCETLMIRDPSTKAYRRLTSAEEAAIPKAGSVATIVYYSPSVYPGYPWWGTP